MEGSERRLEALERSLAKLVDRVERLERILPALLARAQPVPRRTEPERAAPEPAPAPLAASARDRVARDLDLEQLLGGRVLAWLGGLAIVVGAVFFVAMAVRNGWIDESTRVLLAFLGSTLLLAGGLYLYERRGQTEAAVAAVAAAIAALYASLTAATALYDVVAPALGLGVAAVIGAAATAIAVRWDARLVAALGLIGALLSPVLVDAPTSAATLLFMTVALVATVGVLLWRRWDWLASAAFLVSAPQLLAWVDETYDERLTLALVVLAAFWALYVAAAIGYEVRVPTADLRASSALLLLADALLVAGAGWYVLDDSDHAALATTWVLALAVAYLAVGVLAPRRRVSRELGALLIAVALGLSAVGLALALDGPTLVAGRAAEAAVLAWAARRTGDRRGHVAAAAFLGLAAVHALGEEAPPESLRDGVDGLAEATVAVLAVAAAAAVAARFYSGEPRQWRLALTGLAAAALVYAPSIAIVELLAEDGREAGQTPQVALSAFWSVCGLAAIVAGLVRDDRRVRLAGLALLAIAVVKVFLYDLTALDAIYRVLSFIALGLLLLAGAYAYARVREPRERT